MKKKIAIITHEYYPLLCGGTIFSEKLAIEFAKQGHDVEVICSSVGEHKGAREKTGNFWVKRFYTARYSRKTASFLEHIFFLILGLPQFIFYIKRNNFTHLLPIFAVPSGLIAMIISKLTGIPCFVFIDGADTPGIESEQKHLMDHLVFLFRIVTRYSQGAIVLQGVEDLAVPLIQNKNIAIIPNGTSIPPQVAKPGTHAGPLKILSIGRLVARKGFRQIIEACRLVSQQRRDFRLEIIGYGAEEDELRRLISEYKLDDCVQILGSVPYGELSDYYLNCDTYLFYGGREGSSLAMIEALSYGLPIIAADDLGSRTFITDKKNGVLVEWNQPTKLQKAILWLLDHRDSIPAMGLRARNIAERYTWAEIARQYDDFFDASMKPVSISLQTKEHT